MKDYSKYEDQYVITKDFVDEEIILHGDDPLKLYEEAKQLGITDPVIFFISSKPLIFGHGTYTEHHSG